MSEPHDFSPRPVRVAWISDYPIEWLPNLPELVRALPRQHPASWQRVLLDEFQAHPGEVRVDVFALRSRIRHSMSFAVGGTTFHVLKAPRSLRLGSLFWIDVLLLRKRLAKIKPDLVHAWGNERGAGLVATRLNRPFLTTIQGILTWIEQSVPELNTYMRFMTRLEPPALRRTRVATCESRFATDYLRKRYPSLQVHQVEHAPRPVFFEAPRETSDKAIHIVCLGTIASAKGSDLLLRALDRLCQDHEFSLTLIGTEAGDFLDQLRPQTSPDIWRRLTIRHGLTSDEVASEMARSTILVHPTLVDNSPNAVKEAAVLGVPVVASNVGGIPDYIHHGKNGLLFPAGDLDALTSALRDALHHPLFGRGKVNPEIHRQVRDYLSPRRMGEKFLQAYRLTLDAWRPRANASSCG